MEERSNDGRRPLPLLHILFLIEYSIPFTSIILFLSTLRHFILRFLPFHFLFARTSNLQFPRAALRRVLSLFGK